MYMLPEFMMHNEGTITHFNHSFWCAVSNCLRCSCSCTFMRSTPRKISGVSAASLLPYTAACTAERKRQDECISSANKNSGQRQACWQVVHMKHKPTCMLATILASSRPEKPSVTAAASSIISAVMPRTEIASDLTERPRSHALKRLKTPASVPAPAPPAQQTQEALHSRTNQAHPS